MSASEASPLGLSTSKNINVIVSGVCARKFCQTNVCMKSRGIVFVNCTHIDIFIVASVGTYAGDRRNQKLFIVPVACSGYQLAFKPAYIC